VNVSRLGRYFRDRDPTFSAALGPALFLSALIYVRSPLSNYIFDEQEALLANPYVNRKIPFRDVLTRDFWGLPHDRSIGSYRPLPNLVWRAFWQLGPAFQHPWALHWINVVVHSINAACVARIALGLTGRRGPGWLAGTTFALSAVLTEAVTGVVGIADVFGALGLLLAVLCLEASLPKMAIGVVASVALGLFSKESTLVALPILFWVALIAAPVQHPERPLRLTRALVALAAATLSLVVYTETRRRFFPSEAPPALAYDPHWWSRGFHAFLRWFRQPKLPQDPINNPLVLADVPHRVAGALGVYASGVGQALFPWTLSGDYSYAAEPIPERLFGIRTVLGGLLLVGPPLVAVGLWLSALFSERKGRLPGARNRIVVAIALLWAPVAYFPHSNITVTLPTVRADRFWYLPVAGLALGLGVALSALGRRDRLFGIAHAGPALVALFLGFQATRARMHALDYGDDLMFWRATSRAVPKSAKAHLNYGVMLGARGRLEDRLTENRRAVELAPDWAMARIYYADTLCRLNRIEEAWPYYSKGFAMAPNDRNLLALSLQCLWDHHDVDPHQQELIALADDHPGTWLSYLGRDIVWNGAKNGGVEKRYRPRGYNEGPGE
jgi:tetratricopeptide (TPR) repeat protein